MYFNIVNFLLAKIPNGYNSGVHFTEKYTEATDGKMAVRITLPETDRKDLPVNGDKKPFKRKRFDFMVSAESAAVLVRNFQSVKSSMPILRGTWLGSETNEKNVEFLSTDLEVWNSTMVPVQGQKFPNIKRIWNGLRLGSRKTSFAVDPELLKKLLEIYTRAGVRVLRVKVTGPDRAMGFQAELDSGQKIEALLMPIKFEEKKKEKPVKEVAATVPADQEGTAAGDPTA